VLADPRARTPNRRSDYTVKQAFYRLADELRDTVLVACSKCDWKASVATS
jgi:RNase P subunit RPR2